MLLRNIQDVVLSCVPEAVDHLYGECLIIAQELQRRVREPFPHAGVEAKGLFGSRLTNTASSVQDGCLKEHLESVIKENENTMCSPGVGRAVKELNAQYERLNGFRAGVISLPSSCFDLSGLKLSRKQPWQQQVARLAEVLDLLLEHRDLLQPRRRRKVVKCFIVMTSGIKRSFRSASP